MSDEVWTIELNLDGDYAKATSYHIRESMETFRRNVQHAEEGTKIQRWVIVGLAYGFEEAAEKSYRLRMLLCKKHNREPDSEGF